METAHDCVERIRLGDPTGIELLYREFSRGIRFFVSRHLGPQEADDKVHDALLIVVQAIRRGELREPACLPGYVRTVVRHLMADHFGRALDFRRKMVELDCAVALDDPASNPEQAALAHQKMEIMQEVLLRLSPRDREILTRFYLLEQTKQQICAEMGLTETQFRLLKSRAKARCSQARKPATTLLGGYSG